MAVFITQPVQFFLIYFVVKKEGKTTKKKAFVTTSQSFLPSFLEVFSICVCVAKAFFWCAKCDFSLNLFGR